ncbi:TPA: hypothetical protein SLF30_000213 [Acinetobacter baumannii]|nr:hypothetical protein [Acinetobacter baumannii]
MDNYKIKVKDEAESKEAQELFVQLGYSNRQSKRFGFVYTQDGCIGCDSMEHWDYYNDLCQELTLPQLRDLVVLKRNDINDATHTCENDFKYICIDERWNLMTTDGWFHVSVNPKALKPIKKHLETVTGRFDENGEHHLTFSNGTEEKDPALISGADALRALADGKEVVGKAKDYKSEWLDATHWTLTAFLEDTVYFKLKPTTITINTELPKPNKETQHNSLVYAVTYEFKTREERNAFADKLRGTNS